MHDVSTMRGGVYDAEVTGVMRTTKASAVVMVVFNGVRGDAFELQFRVDDPLSEYAVRIMEGIALDVRAIADRIESEAARVRAGLDKG